MLEATPTEQGLALRYGDFATLTEALEWQRGRIRIDAEGRTSESWLWSAGDCVNGPDVVHAVADGHRVAASIGRYLEERGRHR